MKLLKYDTPSGNRVDVGRDRTLVTVAAEPIRPQGVDDEQHDFDAGRIDFRRHARIRGSAAAEPAAEHEGDESDGRASLE